MARLFRSITGNPQINSPSTPFRCPTGGAWSSPVGACERLSAVVLGPHAILQLRRRQLRNPAWRHCLREFAPGSGRASSLAGLTLCADAVFEGNSVLQCRGRMCQRSLWGDSWVPEDAELRERSASMIS